MRGMQDHGPGSARGPKGAPDAKGRPYRIDENLCVGCKVCVKCCHVDAVRDLIIECVIDESRCVGCGRCAHHCPQNAIFQVA